ncbi:putative bifunctional diguanylate cyclase/phosphodiesterase [Mycobacterium sp. MAA66]|uniref:putative bifunctional diguanylate cyclase/phosphodiesterase n=1 Tax=Mycobacterium sp. MAA66 TaxID=3156297 RepID=UPI0035172388
MSTKSEPFGQALVGLDGTWLSVNAVLCQLFHAHDDYFAGKKYHDVVHPDDLPASIQSVTAVIEGRVGSSSFETRYVRVDGTIFYARVHLALARDTLDRRRYGVMQVEDLTAQKAQARAIELANTGYSAIVEHSSDAIAVTDEFGIVRYISPACRAVHGRHPSDLIGTSICDLMHPDDLEEAVNRINRLVVGDLDMTTLSCRIEHPERGWRHIETTIANRLGHPDIAALVCNIRDITERIENAERLQHQALHDTLTGLPNRTLLINRLEHAARAAAHRNTTLALLYIDLDLFKRINDTLGHAVGDQVLIAAAERMKATVRPIDTIARIGGDEFVVLSESLSEPEQASALANRLHQAITEPIFVDQQPVSVGCSIGIAFPADHEDPESVLQEADLAMYRAKELGRNRTEIYNHEMRIRALSRMTTEQAIRWALDHHGIEVQYQPIINLRTGLMACAEALARLRCANGELINAERFVPVAEDTGLIVPLGESVLRTACAQQSIWRANRVATQRITVNVSARQLDALDFIDQFTAILLGNNLHPRHVCLELNESTLIESSSAAHRNVVKLNDMGVFLALDDFGAGWCSLAQLRRFPFDAIKLDSRLVAGLGTTTGDTQIVQAIIGLGHSLGLTVVAEGVETAHQEQLLSSFGCDYAQGYRYAAPLPAGAIAEQAGIRG